MVPADVAGFMGKALSYDGLGPRPESDDRELRVGDGGSSEPAVGHELHPELREEFGGRHRQVRATNELVCFGRCQQHVGADIESSEPDGTDPLPAGYDLVTRSPVRRQELEPGRGPELLTYQQWLATLENAPIDGALLQRVKRTR
jgi:hypothetical protein